MAPKTKKAPKQGPKAKLMEQHEAEQRQQEPKDGKTWEYVCDCQQADCADCAPRNKIYSFQPAHTERVSNAPARFNAGSSVPKAVPRAAVKKGTKPATKSPAKEETVVSPAPQPAVLGERKRVRGH